MKPLTKIRPTTAAEAVASFTSFQVRRGRKASTINQYGKTLKEFASWAGDVELHEIGPGELEEGFVSEWVAEFQTRNGRPPSQASLRNVYVALGAMYGYLSDYALLVGPEGQFVPNPMRAVEAPKATQKQNDWLQTDEDNALLALTLRPHEEIIVHLLRWTGLRLSEATALRVSDVDLTAKTVIVRESKTDAGIRTVPLAPELVPVLRRWFARLDNLGVYSPGAPVLSTTRAGRYRDKATGKVIQTAPGGPMASQSIQRILWRVGGKAGISSPKLCPHRLRRTFGSYLLNRGARLEMVSRLLGHGSTSITEKAYASLSNETIRDEFLRAVGQ